VFSANSRSTQSLALNSPTTRSGRISSPRVDRGRHTAVGLGVRVEIATVDSDGRCCPSSTTVDDHGNSRPSNEEPRPT